MHGHVYWPVPVNIVIHPLPPDMHDARKHAVQVYGSNPFYNNVSKPELEQVVWDIEVLVICELVAFTCLRDVLETGIL